EFITDFFTIPVTATPGLYQLDVVTGDVMNPWMNQQFYTLPNAFTVLPPDGYLEGNVYFDANENGIKDGAETGLQNQNVQVLPEGYYLPTDANGDYSLPAMNGSHTIRWLQSGDNNQLSSDSATYSVVVNSNTQGGFDFGLKPALLSMSINYTQIGGTVFSTITANGAITTAPNSISIRKGGYYIYASNINYIDSNTVTCSFTVPLNAVYIGSYDLWVNLPAVSYNLPAAFTVTAFNSGITGKVYFDTNGNGQYDTGEALLASSKVELTPGNILAWTDNNGDYG